MRRDIDIEQLKEMVNTGFTGYCPVCGQFMQQVQFAHVLSNTRRMMKKYGREIIQSNFNGVFVCSLHCNNSIQMKSESHPIDAIKWVRFVQAKEQEKIDAAGKEVRDDRE